MKKNFKLTNPRHKPERVIESIKGDVRKYLKRERRKTLPEGVDYWDFNCRVGKDETSAEKVHVEEIGKNINIAATCDWESVYIEILAAHGHRKRKEKTESNESSESL